MARLIGLKPGIVFRLRLHLTAVIFSLSISAAEKLLQARK
jgi:hypothetical protein